MDVESPEQFEVAEPVGISSPTGGPPVSGWWSCVKHPDTPVTRFARTIGVSSDTLRFFEVATWRPSMPRLVRLTALYNTDVLMILQDIAESVRPSQVNRRYQPEVEALLYFCGVTPEQVAGRSHAADETEPRPLPSPADVPLGEVLKYRRDDNPLRVQGGLMLRREYEAGASNRTLSVRHRLAFGTIRTLLIEANTQLRGQGGAHHGTAHAREPVDDASEVRDGPPA